MAQTLERSGPSRLIRTFCGIQRPKTHRDVFLGELLRRAVRKNVRDLEVLRPEVDSGGYDFGVGIQRVDTSTCQLKSSFNWSAAV